MSGYAPYDPAMLRTVRRPSGVWQWASAALLALTVLAAAGAAPPASAAASRIVLTPQAGAHVTRAPLPIVIDAPYAARSLRVTLNGVSIARAFSAPDGHGRRRLTASATDALRYGRNVLDVRMTLDGAKRRSQIAFTLSRARPLVGAGPDRRVGVGHAVSLDGTSSRPRTAPASSTAFAGSVRAGGQAGSPAGLAFRWKLVARPKGSRARLKVAPLALQPTGAKPRTLQPATPSILTDKPGRYVVALTVVDRGVASLVDTVTVTGVLATPLVPIDTAATVAGRRGIAVGYHPALDGGASPSGPNEAFYPRGTGNALQMLVLNRSDLSPVATWGGPATTASLAALATQVGTYDDANLVIITAWADPGWAKVGDPAYALTAKTGAAGQIGATEIPFPIFYRDPLTHGGQMTFVGVPTFPAGKAWQTAGVVGGAGLSTLNGFLSPDNNDNYAYLASSPHTYDLGPDGQSVALKLGPSTYTASLPAGQGGFTAVYLDAGTLAPHAGLGQQTYTTRNADGTPNLAGMASMTNDLQSAQNAGVPVLVAVRSIGSQPLAQMGLQPPSYSGPFDQAYATALDQLAGLIAQSGGTVQTFAGMATVPQAASSYSLVGANAAPELPSLAQQGLGAEMGTAMTPPPSSARLAGQLTRNRISSYVPVTAANAPVGGALLKTALAEPSAWPYASTSAGQAAIACVGNAAGLGPDPRSAYWIQPYGGSRWEEIQSTVRSLSPTVCPCPLNGTCVSSRLFGQVQQQLVTEIGWVIDVKGYIASLTAPFTSDGLTSFAELNTITNQVVQAVDPPPAAKPGINILMLFADIADLLDSFDFPAAGTISATFLISGDLFSNTQGGATTDPGEKVVDASDKVGQDLANELQGIAANNDHLVDIVVGDYAKLKKVGTLGGCVSGPSCPAEWQFTQDDQNAASRMYEVNAKRQIWSGILPSAYPYVLQTSSDASAYDGTFSGPQEQISSIGCDYAQPFAVSSPVFLRYGVRAVGDTPFLVFSQTDFQGASSPATNFPKGKLIANLFAPLDPGGDPNEGGLGLDQYTFMTTNWAWTNATKGITLPALKAWRGCGG